MMFRSRSQNVTRGNEEGTRPEVMKPVAHGGAAGRRGLRDITNKSGAVLPGLAKVASGIVKGTKADKEPVGSVAPSVFSSLAALGRSSSASTAPVPIIDEISERVNDIDLEDAHDALAVTGYVEDMFGHFREQELRTGISPNYMRLQPHINEQMRGILVDWLVEVHRKFKLYPETLHLTVGLIDRYLEAKAVTRSKLQLVGVTCLLLASKYEEIYPPELRDLVYMTDRAYTKDEILDMETQVLLALQYRLTLPSMQYFLQRYLKAAHADQRMVHMASYICEKCLVDYGMLKHRPSVVAAAAVYLSRKNSGRSAWSPTLLRYTNYTEEALTPCLQDMTVLLRSATTLRAVHKKYASSKLSKISEATIKGLDAAEA